MGVLRFAGLAALPGLRAGCAFNAGAQRLVTPRVAPASSTRQMGLLDPNDGHTTVLVLLHRPCVRDLPAAKT